MHQLETEANVRTSVGLTSFMIFIKTQLLVELVISLKKSGASDR